MEAPKTVNNEKRRTAQQANVTAFISGDSDRQSLAFATLCPGICITAWAAVKQTLVRQIVFYP